MNYFEWFGISPAFELDGAELKRKYFLKSREVHPDVNDSEKSMDLSSLNNEAFKTLSHRLSRIRYIVDEYSPDGFREELPGDFLFEMMEFNESLEDALLAGDNKRHKSLQLEIQKLDEQAERESAHLWSKGPNELDSEDWDSLSRFLSKQKYFERIRAKIQA